MEKNKLLKSEKQVLVINEFTKLKFVFVDNDGAPIENNEYYSDEQVQNLVNLLAGMIKNNILPIIGDTLFEGTFHSVVKERYFEMENDILFIILDIY